MVAANRTRKAVSSGQWSQATSEWSRTEGVIMSETNGVDFYDVLKKIPYSGIRKFKPVLPGKPRELSLEEIMNEKVKPALGLDRNWIERGQVFSRLSGDFMKPVTNIGK